MSLRALSGTPFQAQVDLTSGAPSANLTYTYAGTGQTYTPAPGEKQYITAIVITSSDATVTLVTVDDGTGGTGGPQNILSGYVSSTAGIPLAPYPGNIVTRPGATLRATAATITATKNIRVSIQGYISKT